ncbi:unnamed protein product [Phytomonas sp. Hart1]|nr:unnamed protein product [Phytomonas sp. Hart1]|eukprot:CCW68102.1 unnamed protein product [Phytomonas sp. isolate Hart1]
MVLSWRRPGEPARHWRLRIAHAPDGSTVDLHRVEWLARRGLASASVGPTRGLGLAMRNTAYAAWRTAVFNHESQFCAQCVSGFAQAKGKLSGILEEKEIDRFGKVAEQVWMMKKKYEQFIIRKRKEILSSGSSRLRSLSLSVKTMFPDLSNLESDLNYILFCSAKHYNCNFIELVDLIGQPMNLGTTFVFCTKNSWFYPCLSITGKIRDPFYGLEGLSVNYTVYWSLSLELQRDMDQIENPCINALSPHIASPLISVCINVSQCRQAAQSMGLPLLFYTGFGTLPTVSTQLDRNFVIVCFALNEISFSDTYPLKVDASSGIKTISSPFPYRIFYGVNFVQRIALASLPASILKPLQCIYPKSFLDTYSTLMVFNALSTHSQKAFLHFTLPGSATRLFSDYGIEVDSIEFELDMRLTRPFSSITLNENQGMSTFSSPLEKSSLANKKDEPELSSSGSPLVLEMSEGMEYDVNFITHGARYYLNLATSPHFTQFPIGDGKAEYRKSLSLSFVGSLSSIPEFFMLQGEVSSGCIPCASIPNAYLSNLSILGTAAASRDSDDDDSAAALGTLYTMNNVILSGRLFLPNGKNYTCSYEVPLGISWNVWREMSVEFVQAPLEEVLRFSEYLFAASDEAQPPPDNTCREKYWSFIRNLNIQVSIQVVVDAVKLQMHGVGSAERIGESTQNLVVSINRSGFKISGTMPFVRFGPILLEGSPSTEKGVFFEVLCDRAVQGVHLRVSGVSSLGTTMAPIPTQIEASSERGVLLFATTRVFDLSIEMSNEQGMFLSTSRGLIAQVNLHKEIIFSEIETQLRAKTIVAALCAHEMPFCLKLHSFIAEPLFLCSSSQTLERPQQWLSFSLNGIFFGGSFDVFSSWILEDMSPSSFHSACKGVVVQIMEQCEESLWSCYANVVGCIQSDDSTNDPSMVDMGLREDRKLSILERHLTSPQGCFMARWIEMECELFEKDLE